MIKGISGYKKAQTIGEIKKNEQVLQSFSFAQIAYINALSRVELQGHLAEIMKHKGIPVNKENTRISEFFLCTVMV